MSTDKDTAAHAVAALADHLMIKRENMSHEQLTKRVVAGAFTHIQLLEAVRNKALRDLFRERAQRERECKRWPHDNQ